MANKNIEVINDANYSITDRTRPVKKKRHVLGTVLALVFSLLLALFMRYYVEFSGGQENEGASDAADKNVQCYAESVDRV